MSTQVAEKANLCLVDFLAVWQGMVAACVVRWSLALDLLACLRVSAAAVMFASQVAAPLYRD